MRVGFIGLGHMGLPMARRLAGEEFALSTWNRTPGRATTLASTGVTLAASPAEVAASSDVVITMLSDAAAVRAVLSGTDGLISAMRAGATVVDMSTIGPEAAREFGALAGLGWLGFGQVRSLR